MTEIAPKRKSPRWMKILLTVSLALNLLVVGAVGSKFFFKRHHGSKGQYSALARPGALHKAGRRLMWELPRERRKELLQVVSMYSANMKPERNNLVKTRLALAKTIASQPDNQAAFDEQWKLVEQAEAAFRLKASSLTADFIKNLTPAERKTYAEILQKPPRHRWFKKPMGH